MEAKDLHKSATNRILAGVAGGLAEYFNVDATLVRLIFVVLSIYGGLGVISYLVLALIMPEANVSKKTPVTQIKEQLSEVGRDSRQRPRSRGVAFFLISIGLIFLLQNLNLLPSGWANTWPLILIALGLWLLLRPYLD